MSTESKQAAQRFIYLSLSFLYTIRNPCPLPYSSSYCIRSYSASTASAIDIVRANCINAKEC